eukprot:g73411.t1
MSDQWFFVSAQRVRVGPVSQEVFIQQFRAGNAPAASLCWNPTMATWTPIQNVPGLLQILSPPVPMAPAGAQPPPGPPPGAHPPPGFWRGATTGATAWSGSRRRPGPTARCPSRIRRPSPPPAPAAPPAPPAPGVPSAPGAPPAPPPPPMAPGIPPAPPPASLDSNEDPMARALAMRKMKATKRKSVSSSKPVQKKPMSMMEELQAAKNKKLRSAGVAAPAGASAGGGGGSKKPMSMMEEMMAAQKRKKKPSSPGPAGPNNSPISPKARSNQPEASPKNAGKSGGPEEAQSPTKPAANSKTLQARELLEAEKESAEVARLEAAAKAKEKEELEEKRAQALAEQQAKAAKERAEWSVMVTQEGTNYYHNNKTGETSWDKPACLVELDGGGLPGDWYWMPDAEDGYIPVKKLEASGTGKTVVENEQGEKFTLDKAKDAALIKLQWHTLKKEVRDLVLLDEMNKPLILNSLKIRMKKNEIYTNVGTILISLNPYLRLPLYTPTVIDEYRYRGSRTLPPHVFLIADAAYNNLIDKSKGQSIVISGESGAGKTECTKQALQFLAEVAGSATNVEQKILQANPILESFGNAKTVRNNNSSRFGKYVEILFDQRNSICGATTTNYLLEKSRVVDQQTGERNYHIFYQMCVVPAMRDEYGLKTADLHHFLNQGGDIVSEGVDDAEEYQDVLVAMDKLDFDPSYRKAMFAIVAGIIHFGDVTFKSVGEKKVEVVNTDALKRAAEFFNIKEEDLTRCVTVRTLQMKGDKPIDVSLGLDEAIASRNAFCKYVYAAMFDWLVLYINKAIGMGSAQKGKVIGILDIFGFEIFKVNSFEQLCINYANEKLQQFFNHHTFKMEEKIYREEKISFQGVPFVDNQPVLDLIEKKNTGILAVVDEELKMPKGSDLGFVNKLHDKQASTECYAKIVSLPDHFTVKHYAGDVIYNSEGFLVKNNDKMSDDLFSTAEKSAMPFLKTIMADSGGDSKSRTQTLGGKFAAQLSGLMTALNQTEPHYIRCVKPNAFKQPMQFNGGMVLEQLTYSGVFEAVEIRKKGFPFRWSHKDFMNRFKVILPKKKWSDPKAGCLELIKAMKVDNIQVGVSRVLYRSEQHQAMELQRNIAVDKTVRYLQKHIRGWRMRRLVKQLLAIRPVLRAAIVTRTLDALSNALDQCQDISFEIKEMEDARALKLRILEEQRVQALLEQLIQKNPEEPEVLEELSKTIAAADELDIKTPAANRAREMVTTIKDRQKTRQWLKDGAVEYNEEKLSWAVKRYNELQMNMPELLAKGEEALAAILAEKKVVEKLVEQAAQGAFLKEGDVPDGSKLEAALAAPDVKALKLERSQDQVKLFAHLVKIRQALSRALAEKLDPQLWKEVESHVLAASEDFGEEKEVEASRVMASKHAAESETVARIEKSMKPPVHYENLVFGLEQASVLKLDDAKYKVVAQARDMKPKLDQCREAMKQAKASRDESDLVYAVQLAQVLGYAPPELEKLKQTRDEIISFNSELDYCLQMLDEAQMKALYAKAQIMDLKNNSRVDKLHTLMFDTPEAKFVSLQLKAAVLKDDPGRISRATIRLKDLFFKNAGTRFELSNFTHMRTAAGWAKLKKISMHRKKLEDSYWSFTKVPIHAALTDLNGKFSKTACRMFKNVMGFMGDRLYESPDLLAEEMLQTCLDNDWLRDEVYVQIIKQLTDNPSGASRKKGWTLLALCLETFSPSRDFENYFEFWLRQHAGRSQDLQDTEAGVYGMELRDAILESPYALPVPLHVAIEYLTGRESRLQEEGLFRIPGNAETVVQLKAQFDKREEVVLTDTHNAAGLLKLYLRELPTPLIPFNMYEPFLEATENKDKDTMLTELAHLVQELPTMYQVTLGHLMRFLYVVQTHADKNKMTATNLAIVFAPNLLVSPDPTLAAKNIKKCNTVIEWLIQSHHTIFPKLDQVQSEGDEKTRYLRLLHVGINQGPLEVSPSVDEIHAAAKGISIRDVDFKEQDTDTPPKPDFPPDLPTNPGGPLPSKEDVFKYRSEKPKAAGSKQEGKENSVSRESKVSTVSETSVASISNGSTSSLSSSSDSTSQPGPTGPSADATNTTGQKEGDAASATPSGAWKVAYAGASQKPYYYNLETGQTTWKKPPGL